MADLGQEDLIVSMLAEARREAAEDRRAIESRLSGIAASTSHLQALVDSHGRLLAEMRAENRSEMHALSNRMQRLEEQAQAIPHYENRLNKLEDRVGVVSAAGDRRHQEIDTRVRALEGDSRETGVFRRGASSLAGAFLRWALPVVAAAVAAALMTGRIGA